MTRYPSSSPPGSPGDRGSAASPRNARQPDPAKLHPDNAHISRLEESLYLAPLPEKKAIVQKLIKIHRHNIGALAHASTQPRDKVEMLLEADLYLRLRDEARREKLRNDVALLEDMKEKTMAQIVELGKMVEGLEERLRLAEHPRQDENRNQIRQIRDRNQRRQLSDPNQPRWGRKQTRTVIERK